MIMIIIMMMMIIIININIYIIVIIIINNGRALRSWAWGLLRGSVAFAQGF
jgi:hypothetical protein